MVSFQVLYWQNIPSQVKVWDNFDEVMIELAPRFAAMIDAAAQAKGLTGTDEYLEQWHWGEIEERDGTVQEVAKNVVSELESREYPG